MSLTVLIGIYSRFAAWNIPVSHVERLRVAFPAHTFLHVTSDEEALALAPRADVAFMSEVRPHHFAAAQKLRWVHSPAAGVGGMLFPEMRASGVTMTNSSGISADTIAEHVVALTLALFRKLPAAVRSQAAREWAQDAMMSPPAIRTIQGSRVLVVGLGAIGGACARRLAALGATVAAIRRRPAGARPEGVSAVFSPDALLAQLPAADVVVIAAPQTRHTRGLIGTAALEAMRTDAILVNVSRGRLVDEPALIDALRRGAIGGAGLDVFAHEPLDPASPLWDLPNVLITPHMSGFRPDHWDVMTDLFAENLRRYTRGEPLLNQVDKEAGY